MRFAPILPTFVLALLFVSCDFAHAQVYHSPNPVGGNWPVTAVQLAVTGTIAILAGAFLMRTTMRPH